MRACARHGVPKLLLEAEGRERLIHHARDTELLLRCRYVERADDFSHRPPPSRAGGLTSRPGMEAAAVGRVAAPLPGTLKNGRRQPGLSGPKKCQLRRITQAIGRAQRL